MSVTIEEAIGLLDDDRVAKTGGPKLQPEEFAALFDDTKVTGHLVAFEGGG